MAQFNRINLLAILVSFFSIFGAFILIPIGTAAFIIMLYRSVQKTAAFSHSPFWIYIPLIIMARLALTVVLSDFVMPEMDFDGHGAPALFEFLIGAAVMFLMEGLFS